MRSLLEQLENNESVLLMYAAGELPPDDAAEVEQMLASDPTLRAEYERLAGLNAWLRSDFDNLASREMSAQSLADGQEKAARFVARAVREDHLRRLAQPAPPRARGTRVPAWTYPFAAAAAVLIGMMGWWGHVPFDPVKPRRHPPSAGGDVAVVSEYEQRRMVESLWPTDQERDPASLASSETADDLNALLRQIGSGELK